MSFLFRVAVYVPVLYLIAIVVVGQHHTTAAATLRAALRRTGRWLVWTAGLLGAMWGLELLFIGW
ncbi:MAG: hypothetical protein JNK49_20785 [Planctomycetes bacterium]|nr:hypothetical protein [Planctomycetota bacterium]